MTNGENPKRAFEGKVCDHDGADPSLWWDGQLFEVSGECDTCGGEVEGTHARSGEAIILRWIDCAEICNECEETEENCDCRACEACGALADEDLCSDCDHDASADDCECDTCTDEEAGAW